MKIQFKIITFIHELNVKRGHGLLEKGLLLTIVGWFPFKVLVSCSFIVLLS